MPPSASVSWALLLKEETCRTSQFLSRPKQTSRVKRLRPGIPDYFSGKFPSGMRAEPAHGGLYLPRGVGGIGRWIDREGRAEDQPGPAEAGPVAPVGQDLGRSLDERRHDRRAQLAGEDADPLAE